MKRKSVVALGLALICIVGLLLAPSLLKLSLISPGWEIYDQIGALRYNDQVYSEASQFTTPRELMGVYWKVDLDDPNYGVPTLMVEVGDIHHVDFMGRDISNDEYAQTRTVTRGNNTYYLDYHIYLYTVTIRTIADVRQTGGSPPWSAPSFDHETSWPYEFEGTFGNGGTENNPPHVGKVFDGGVYTKFVISPWRGGTYRDAPNSSYVLDNCWAGVMNTYVLDKTEGQVQNQFPPSGDNPGGMPTPEGNAQITSRGGIDKGNQVPMLEDDGTFNTPAPVTNWDSGVTPDTRIESTVVHFLPVALGAGAKLHDNMYFQVDAIYPCDGYIQYSLRVDVLQTHEFTLETAYNPPTPVIPTDYFSWAQDFWTSFLRGIDPFKIFGPLEPFIWFLFTLFVIGVIIFIVLAIFAPWTLPRIFGGVHSSAKALRGKS